ncbi:hypothetical protein GHT09_011632 [Marmota monax]|uniref:Uncharacterized protein n=1 Tax=Marmota monax TaxID=9995 RepID=A0A834QD54_MARMO|nr:hypothetical protein GHT09_011632 [Marmota monax]
MRAEPSRSLPPAVAPAPAAKCGVPRPPPFRAPSPGPTAAEQWLVAAVAAGPRRAALRPPHLGDGHLPRRPGTEDLTGASCLLNRLRECSPGEVGGGPRGEIIRQSGPRSRIY